MPNLKEVLADKTKYPDNLVWNLEAGSSVTLGQLRSLDAETKAAVTRQETELSTSRTKLDNDTAEMKRAQLNVANLFTALTQAQEAIATGRFDSLPPEVKSLFKGSPVVGNNGGNDPFAVLSRLESDSLMGPVVQVIKKVAEDARKAQDAVAANVEVQKKMATNYMNGVLEDRYDRIVPTDKQDKITLAALIQDAVRNNEFSSDSVPDIRRAYKRATAADSQAAHDSEVAAAAIKKYQAEHPATVGTGNDGIFVGQPQNFGLDVHNRSGSAPKPFKSLDEAFAAAAADKDIWSAVDQTVQ